MTQPVFINYCRFVATAGGTTAFVVASAAPLDANNETHDTPENCRVVDGRAYRYYAQSADGSQTESGNGIYTVSSHQLARTKVFVNSDGTTTPVNFASPPIVDVFPNPQNLLDTESVGIQSGTEMLFHQTIAPIGWTKQTTHNDKALRVVSGAVSSGGTNSFSSVMAQTTVGAHQLTIAEIPSHAHDSFGYTTGGGGLGGLAWKADGVSGTDLHINTGSAGGDGTHTHPITMAIQYVDLIIAVKN